MIEFSNLIEVTPIDSGVGSQPRVYEFIADTFSYIPWKSHTNLTHPGKYFRPSKVKIMRPTSPK